MKIFVTDLESLCNISWAESSKKIKTDIYLLLKNENIYTYLNVN